MNALVLSRLQFAFTVGYHILWPTFSIGIASYVAVLSVLWWRTGRTVYRDLMRFWIRMFGLGFGMGVITGVVLSYEIGANWSGFSRAVGNVLGPLFMYETLTAFFLEAGFVGVMLFGAGRVSQATHAFACAMVALGALISATWIIAANSWMQTPAGTVADANGVFHVLSWSAVIFNPSFPYRLMHMVCASFLTGAFLVAGVSAFHLWQRRHLESARVAFSMALWTALALAPLQLILGDMHGRNTLKYQPTKLAAIEGLWNSGRGVSATLIGWPDMEQQKNLYAISIPHMGSVYLTHSWEGEVQGLKAVPRADQPFVPLPFFAFRLMVGIGLLLFMVAVTSAILRWRARLYDTRWFLIASMTAMPLGFIAVLAGWVVTESGRQPYVVYGLLRTAAAISPVSVGAISTSLILFVLIYTLLLAAYFWFSIRLVIDGPGLPPGTTSSGVARPGLDRAGPTVVGAPPAPTLPSPHAAANERLPS